MSPDDAQWSSRVQGLNPASALIRWGSKAQRLTGWRRVVRLVALRVGCSHLQIHRWLWLWGWLR